MQTDNRLTGNSKWNLYRKEMLEDHDLGGGELVYQLILWVRDAAKHSML